MQYKAGTEVPAFSFSGGGDYPRLIAIFCFMRLFHYEKFGGARSAYMVVSGREVEIRTDMPDPSLARAD
ncbi:hypothetical protein DKK66_03325 [Aquitalea sp. USM4]|nr:hypothetical protein DKK66_03325 [Aquitalea sp. USM4]